MNSTTQSKEIVLLRKDARHLDARKAVAERKMRLPPHPLLDAYVQTNIVHGLWADELLAHPVKDGVFQSGKDVVDALTGMILPASYMPKKAVGRKDVGLFIVPEDVREERGKVIVHAQSVIVLEGITQVSDQWVPGKPDVVTKIPLVVSEEEFKRLPEEERRWLYRIAGEGVRPLVRGHYYGDCDAWIRYDKRYVYAGFGQDVAFGVAGLPAIEGGAPQKLSPLDEAMQRATQRALVDIGAIEHVRGLEYIQELVGKADATVQELSATVLPEKLAPIRELLESLRAKE